jgi:hypothetical protein
VAAVEHLWQDFITAVAVAQEVTKHQLFLLTLNQFTQLPLVRVVPRELMVVIHRLVLMQLLQLAADVEILQLVDQAAVD